VDLPSDATKNQGSRQTEMYPLPAFYFKVVVAGLSANSDTSFQEIRGIGSEMETEEVPEGGENRFVHRLPKAVKHPQLELKRGITASNSQLSNWCRSVLESGWGQPIKPAQVTVFLLDENASPARAWTFADAFPVKWEVDEFKSTKNEVAIETMVLSYTYSNRIL
jgi:phage tail-like protein